MSGPVVGTPNHTAKGTKIGLEGPLYIKSQNKKIFYMTTPRKLGFSQKIVAKSAEVRSQIAQLQDHSQK